MRYLTFFLILLLCGNVWGFTEPGQPIYVIPCWEKMSVSTVTVNTATYQQCPPTALRGRKEIYIVNMDAAHEVYLSNVSEDTVKYYFPLYPRQGIRIKASSDMPIFIRSNYVVNLRVMEIK